MQVGPPVQKVRGPRSWDRIAIVQRHAISNVPGVLGWFGSRPSGRPMPEHVPEPPRPRPRADRHVRLVRHVVRGDHEARIRARLQLRHELRRDRRHAGPPILLVGVVAAVIGGYAPEPDRRCARRGARRTPGGSCGQGGDCVGSKRPRHPGRTGRRACRSARVPLRTHPGVLRGTQGDPDRPRRGGARPGIAPRLACFLRGTRGRPGPPDCGGRGPGRFGSGDSRAARPRSGDHAAADSRIWAM